MELLNGPGKTRRARTGKRCIQQTTHGVYVPRTHWSDAKSFGAARKACRFLTMANCHSYNTVNGTQTVGFLPSKWHSSPFRRNLAEKIAHSPSSDKTKVLVPVTHRCSFVFPLPVCKVKPAHTPQLHLGVFRLLPSDKNPPAKFAQ